MSRASLRPLARSFVVLAACLSLIVFRPPPVFAQENESSPIALPEVTVSTTTIPQPTADVGSSVTVLTDQQLQDQQRRTVPDALTVVPGLNVVQTGGPGGQTSVFIRGTNSNHVKVFIDGIDASDPSNPNGSFDFGQLLTSDLDSIEILRGPQSGLYGSDAIGGVISIFTKRGDGPPQFTFEAEGGSFGTANEKLRFSGSTPIWDYAFSLAHYAAHDVPVTPSEILPPGRNAIPNSNDNYTFSTKLGLHLSESVYADTTLRYIDSLLKFTGTDYSYSPAVPEAQHSEQQDEQLFTRSEIHYDPVGTTIKNRVGVSYTQSYSTDMDPENGNSAYLGQRLKYDYQGQVDILKGETLIVGAETETDRLATDTPVFARNDNSAGYAQLVSNIGDRLYLASNVRYDDNASFGGHTTFRVAPSFHVPVTDTIIKGSYGSGFKAPTLSELYVNYPSFGFYGNPYLKPEESTGYDAGLEQPLFHDRIRVGATYYQNNITNLIEDNATFTSYTNVGRAKTYGVETFASYTVSEMLKLRADYTLTIAEDEILHEELLRRPRNKGSLQVLLTPISHLTLSTTVVAIGAFVDGNYDFSIPRLENGGHTTVNLAASYDIDEHERVFARIDNLGNLRYEDPTGFLQPGLAAYGGMRFTY